MIPVPFKRAAENFAAVFRGFRHSPAIGVDIGSHSAKVVVLLKNPRHPSGFSVRAGEVFPPSGSRENSSLDDFSLRSQLSFLCDDFGLKGRRAAFSISGSSVFASRFEIAPDEDSEKKIHQAAALHLERFFPEGAQGCRYDFHRPAGSLHVFVALAKKQTVDDYVSVISDSGFIPAVMDYEGFALVNSHTRLAPPGDGSALLLNVGRRTTNVAAVENSLPVFTQDLPCGSEDLTLAVAAAGNLTTEEAEVAKCSSEQEPKFASVAREFAFGAARKVKSSLEIFLGSGKKFDRVEISGGGALSPGFREAVAEVFDTETAYADPLGNFETVSQGGDGDHIRRLSAKTAVASGLALRMAG